MHALTARIGLDRVALRRDDGMTTAEYAVGTVAACGFGTVLYRILTSDTVSGWIRDLVERAITSVFG